MRGLFPNGVGLSVTLDAAFCRYYLFGVAMGDLTIRTLGNKNACCGR